MSEAKCELKKNGFFDWCTGMKKCLEPMANEGHKGLIQVNLSNLETMKTTCLGVKYKLNAQDKGLLLNICPWCGEKIINGHNLRPTDQDKKKYAFVEGYKPTESI